MMINSLEPGADLRELDERQLLALLDYDPVAERLLGRLESALSDLKLLAGRPAAASVVKL